MSEKVKVKVLVDELKNSMGTFYKGHIFEVMDNKKIRKSALDGLIEYIDPNQTALFE